MKTEEGINTLILLFLSLTHSLQMRLVYLSSEVYQSHDYTLWTLEFKKKWQSDLPAWKVIFIMDGSIRSTHICRADGHLPIPKTGNQFCKDTDGSWRCMACPSVQRQVPPSRKALLLYHRVPVCTLSCFPQKYKVKNTKDTVVLDTAEYICCNGPHAGSQIPAHSKDSQPPANLLSQA